MTVAAHAVGRIFRPARDRTATHADRRGAGQWFDDPKQRGGSVKPAILFKARAEVGDPEAIALGGADFSYEDIRIRQIALRRIDLWVARRA